MHSKPLVISIIGPTASGKSEMAVKLAKKIGGEIISADSRQVYRGMDIGSGKIAGRITKPSALNPKSFYTYKSIPHYGIDIANPATQYSVAKFQKYSHRIIKDILKRGKTPIICGGTGHWVDAILFNQSLPNIKPNPKLRKKLEKLSTKELFSKLEKIDPDRAKNIDAKNPRRLIRALEIVMTTGKPVPPTNTSSPYEVLWIGIKTEQEKLYKKINNRLKERFRQGMIKEVSNLHKHGLSWKKLEEFGLEYKYCALYLQNKLSKEEMGEQLFQAIKKYSKRQLTWFKRNKNIHWISKFSEINKLVKKNSAEIDFQR